MYDSVVHIIFLKLVVAFKKVGWVLSVEYKQIQQERLLLGSGFLAAWFLAAGFLVAFLPAFIAFLGFLAAGF